MIHRDYSIADDIHVRVFDNRIEVESPGPFVAHVNENNVLTTRFSRNGNLVRWINKFPDPPNKDVGEGLRTAFDAMKSHKLKPPVIAGSPTSVLVKIGHDQLASPGEMIIEYLQNNDEVTNARVRELTGIGSENEVKQIPADDPCPDRSSTTTSGFEHAPHSCTAESLRRQTPGSETVHSHARGTAQPDRVPAAAP